MKDTYLIEANIAFVYSIKVLIKATSKEDAVYSFTYCNTTKFKEYLHLGPLSITNVVNITALETIE